MKTETLHFRYNSIENIVHLLCDIQFEKMSNSSEISIYHSRFDGNDEIFKQFLLELFPEGKTIDTDDIITLINYIKAFMKNDDKSQNLLLEYKLRNSNSYVYFKPEKIFIDCRCGSHYEAVCNIFRDYFKGFNPNELSEEYVRRFVSDNFVIKSDFTTADKIAKDWQFLSMLAFDDDKVWWRE